MAYALSPQISLASDIDFYSDTKPIFKQGMEYAYGQTLFLRVGYEYTSDGRSFGNNNGFSVGGGLKISACELDYTYSPYQDFGNTHRIALAYKFGPKRALF